MRLLLLRERCLISLSRVFGKTFQGYKGGDFIMHDYTDVHISVEGSFYDYVWDWLFDFHVRRSVMDEFDFNAV